MSLNKTLDRLFDEIRREAKRNAAFADRLDAVLRLHESRRDVGDETIEDVVQQSSPASGGGGERERAGGGKSGEGRAAPPQSASLTSPPQAGAQGSAPALNPAGLYKRAGEDALTEALVALDRTALQALIAEHNLDPSGVAARMDSAELVAHIVAQAKKRAERDEKMFDY